MVDNGIQLARCHRPSSLCLNSLAPFICSRNGAVSFKFFAYLSAWALLEHTAARVESGGARQHAYRRLPSKSTRSSSRFYTRDLDNCLVATAFPWPLTGVTVRIRRNNRC